MKKHILITLAIVLALATIVCAITSGEHARPPVTLKFYMVSGARTPEADIPIWPDGIPWSEEWSKK